MRQAAREKSAMSEMVLYKRRGDSVWVTMNRPEVRNALSREHITAIREAMERATGEPDARAIVLAGADPVFCAIAVEGTRFSLSEARLGIVPAVISEAVLTALGPRNARQLMLRSEPFNTEEALRIGLVQEVVAAEEIDAAIEEVVGQFRQGAPGALADIKKLLHTLTQTPVTPEGKRSMILNLAADRRASEEGQEGLRAFLEKRKPSWATAGDGESA
jgi:enoyl-CoA hydratase/carnithine racemase